MMNKIIDLLYVGSWVDAQMLTHSNPEIITAVLNVCEELDDFSKMPMMKYYHCPFPDERQIPKPEFEKCMEWLEQRYKTHNRILIHCAMGRSRSPVICASFMSKIGLASGVGEALLMIKSVRPEINPSPLVLGSAKAYLTKAEDYLHKL